MIDTHISQINSDDHLSRYQWGLAEMSEPRRAREMKPLRKAEWLVKSAIAEILSFKFTQIKTENDPLGKPYCLQREDLQLSLAHAGQYELPLPYQMAVCSLIDDFYQTLEWRVFPQVSY